jgi:hypothetical protein
MVKYNNKAAWLPKPHGKLEVGDGPEAQVGEEDVLIENKAVAINPGMCMPYKECGLEADVRISGLEDSRLQFFCQGVPRGKHSLKKWKPFTEVCLDTW